ncbi:MAG: serine/threonine protein kinase, partial [Candidatus Wallbacteria bacterium]|nr:serine/threonine protein kinase [Candidatus Wallbacteria bacterium]
MTLHGEQPEELMPGSLFGAYRIHRLLGAGGMGVVYEASQVSLQRLVALKVLAPELTGDEQSRKRFVQEGRLAARVSHPNLVRVLEVAEVGGRLMLAHELVVGETLDRRLARCGPLPVREAIEVAEVTADVLATLHDAGILHRDLKPANLFVSSDRGILVGDLGLAKDQLSCAVKTRAGNILGTPAYMAPESIQGRMATPATDLYALGIVFFECLAGHPPFSAAGAGELLRMQVSAAVPSVRPMRPELPAEFDVFLKKALAKDPAERFPSATVFSRELA